MTLTNWAGNTTFRARNVHHPTSLDELRRIVARGERVRALGSGHSFNDVADGPGDLVVLDRLPETRAGGVEIDTAAACARVPAGMTYARLATRLDAAGFALANLASLPHISVAGSVATGTHGSGERNQSLSAAVRGLDLVTADGSVVSVKRGDPDFPGMVVALGALGVVTSLTLDLVPAFELRQYVVEDVPADAGLDEVMASGYSVSLFTDWRATRAWVKRRDELERAPWPGTRLADGPRHPVPGMPPGSCTAQLGAPGPWHERLPHFRHDAPPSSAGDELQSEFALPRAFAAQALRELYAAGDRIRPVLQVSEVRAVAADDLWLSPFRGRDSIGVHFTWVKDPAAVLPVIELVEDVLAPFDPRPHWGKLFTRRYPCPDGFRELVGRHDPKGVFGNAFLSLLLGE
ncbi:FAD-binding protein [Nonomuraea pusilla]|uniref:Xylitol oxidase n=1 Tax=Nonomuraea pusilla TaxID=46177 RepID=A0A1H7ZAG1_9ACTN|nr:FAD-binding protein [Nonomuraea pusilla]SEM54459.1 xylitol oxidase [Nonomuraea pusilla]